MVPEHLQALQRDTGAISTQLGDLADEFLRIGAEATIGVIDEAGIRHRAKRAARDAKALLERVAWFVDAVETPGQVAYEAYAEAAGVEAPSAAWSRLLASDRNAWEGVAEAVLDRDVPTIK